MNATIQEMQNRVANGCDPLSGRPMQCVGPIRVCDDGKCRDANGIVVEVSEHGDWVPAE